MSQRFGRNQRRRAREAIAALESQKEAQRTHIREVSDRLQLVSGELEEAKEIAFDMSILFPANETMPAYWPSSERQPIRHYPMGKCALDDLPHSRAVSDMIRLVDFETLVVSINPEHMSRAMHVKVQFADGVWGYGITADAWQSLRDSHRRAIATRAIAKLLAEAMAKHTVRSRYAPSL